MTKVLPLPPSPQLLTYDMFLEQVLPQETHSTYQAPVPAEPPKKDNKTQTQRKSRPSYPYMIEEAIYENFQKKKGVSLAAIKKFLEQKYNVDTKGPAKARICRYIRMRVSDGRFKQHTGRGANGSFSLAPSARKEIQIKKEQMSQSKARSRKAISMPTKRENIKPLKGIESLLDPPVTRMSVKVK